MISKLIFPAGVVTFIILASTTSIGADIAFGFAGFVGMLLVIALLGGIAFVLYSSRAKIKAQRGTWQWAKDNWGWIASIGLVFGFILLWPVFGFAGAALFVLGAIFVVKGTKNLIENPPTSWGRPIFWGIVLLIVALYAPVRGWLAHDVLGPAAEYVGIETDPEAAALEEQNRKRLRAAKLKAMEEAATATLRRIPRYTEDGYRLVETETVVVTRPGFRERAKVVGRGRVDLPMGEYCLNVGINIHMEQSDELPDSKFISPRDGEWAATDIVVLSPGEADCPPKGEYWNGEGKNA